MFIVCYPLHRQSYTPEFSCSKSIFSHTSNFKEISKYMPSFLAQKKSIKFKENSPAIVHSDVTQTSSSWIFMFPSPVMKRGISECFDSYSAVVVMIVWMIGVFIYFYRKWQFDRVFPIFLLAQNVFRNSKLLIFKLCILMFSLNQQH